VVTPTPILAVVLVVLVLIAVAAVWLAGLPLRAAMVSASVRAAVQLAIVSALIAIVFRSVALTFAYVGMMAAVATLTATRRMSLPLGRLWAAVPVLAGTVPVVGLILATGTVPWKPQSILPIAGIVVGNTMTATILAGRRMLEELDARAGQYEAALSLGLGPRASALEVARPSAALALLPPLDQTRTVGLVTLPGAFVGVLLGGGTPVQAGAAQVLVLIGLLAAESISVLFTIHLVATRRLMGDELRARLPV
jgi:putative ABC transport system permease protein